MMKRGTIPHKSNTSLKLKVSSTPASSGKKSVDTLKSDYSKLSEKEKISLSRLLCESAVFFLESERTVYLDRFGLLIPKKETQNVVRYFNSQGLIRPETHLSVIFEKCIELTAYHRNRFGKIVELKELSNRIYPRLPQAFALKWKENNLRKILQALIKEIQEEIVISGSSSRLYLLGTFYALHNRHGDNFNDWLAGSDIFLAPSYKQLITTGTTKFFNPASFDTAWEPFQCMYGAPLTLFSVDVRKELQLLRYNLPKNQAPLLKVAAFTKDSASNEILFCTEGLRNTHIKGESSARIEFTFQLKCKEDDDYIAIASRTLALGWYLLYTKGSVNGTCLNCHTPLNKNSFCKLTSIFTTDFSQIRHATHTTQGEFKYINIIWITDSEANMLKQSLVDHLSSLLKYKKLDQLTLLNRQDLVGKSLINSDIKPYAKLIESHSLINQTL